MQSLTRWTWIAASTAALTAALLILEGIPRLAHAAELGMEWRSRKATLAQEPLTPAERRRLEAERDRLRGELGAVFGDVPSGSPLSSVVGLLQREAAASGVALARVEPGAPVTDGAYARLPVRVTVRGSAHEVGVFVDAVERSALLMKVRALSVVGQGLTEGPVEAGLDVEAVRLHAGSPRTTAEAEGGV